MAGILIAGGGLAAQRACETLRRSGYEGRLRVIAAEPHQPYDRPPLSKEYLAAEIDESALWFRSSDWYAENDVELLADKPATRLDPAGREVTICDGTRIAYEQLLIATGSSPRRLPIAAGYENVHELRTLDDARALRAALGPGRRLAVIGAGFIGQEVAATAKRLGAEVTLIEAAEVPLAPVLGSRLGAWFARLHREEGIEVLLSAYIERLHGAGAVEAIQLVDGRVIECDSVVVGVGTEPATSWLRGSGLSHEGVCVDSAGRSVIPGVFAAGDASRPFDRRLGGHVRTEHWEAAARQGAAAARAMLGLQPAVEPPPSFWSDQHGLRVQFVGHSHGADTVEIDGDSEGRDFTATFRDRGRPVAALLVGRPDALPEVRRHIHAATAEMETHTERKAA
jgi:3-phenylpropionate/trans-cinnamate dioxygenase ferredoxin reductase component